MFGFNNMRLSKCQITSNIGLLIKVVRYTEPNSFVAKESETTQKGANIDQMRGSIDTSLFLCVE